MRWHCWFLWTYRWCFFIFSMLYKIIYLHSFSDTTDVMLQGKDRYPYPVGFHAVRCYNGEIYQMEIHEGTRGPLFVVRRTRPADKLKLYLSNLCISSILFTWIFAFIVIDVWIHCMEQVSFGDKMTCSGDTPTIAWQNAMKKLNSHSRKANQRLLNANSNGSEVFFLNK